MKRLAEKIKKHIIVLTAILMLLIYIGIIIIIYVIRQKNWASWEDINALEEWANILIAILIPIAAIYLEKRLEKMIKKLRKKKEEIKNSNISMFDEIHNLKNGIKELKENKNVVTPISNDEIDDIILKDDIYDFICISMKATTKEIMDKFKIDFSKAKSILLKLSRIDGKIKIAYVDENEEDENCTWKKK